MEIPPMLGPHEGRELELLLSGEKPIALFYEGIPDEFLPYLESGILQYKIKTISTCIPHLKIENILIYKNIAIDQVNELMAALEQSANQPESGFMPEVERQIGQLLGYREIDIEYYIDHVLSRRK